jgi:hypothetical protein
LPVFFFFLILSKTVDGAAKGSCKAIQRPSATNGNKANRFLFTVDALSSAGPGSWFGVGSGDRLGVGDGDGDGVLGGSKAMAYKLRTK